MYSNGKCKNNKKERYKMNCGNSDGSKLDKRKSVGQESFDEIVVNYKNRCENEIGVFNFGHITIFNDFLEKKEVVKRGGKWDKKVGKKEGKEEGGYLPKQIISYLKKFMR